MNIVLTATLLQGNRGQRSEDAQTMPKRFMLFVVAALVLSATSGSDRVVAAGSCPPTPWDEIGPFYRQNAPVRTKIGNGYVLTGTVRSSADCKPVTNARIEVWQTGPSGTYDDSHRATLFPDWKGEYRLETDFPAGYAGRNPHIHILVDAKGYTGLITQHYPKKGTSGAVFDLVMAPEP
jgi:protocatechuate 3,4-dioxygenase beta subunit